MPKKESLETILNRIAAQIDKVTEQIKAVETVEPC
jgi:hypothetical protein